MKLSSDSFKDGGTIPDQFAFCTIDSHTHVRSSGNRNPHLIRGHVLAEAAATGTYTLNPALAGNSAKGPA